MKTVSDYDIIIVWEAIMMGCFDIIRSVIGSDLLTDFQINQWLKVPKFVNEVLYSHQKYKSFDGGYIIVAMKHCMPDFKGIQTYNGVRVEVLKRSLKQLEAHRNDIKGYDDVHKIIKDSTCLMNREIKYWRRVKDFEDKIISLRSSGDPISNQTVLKIMVEILNSNRNLDAIDGAMVNILNKIAVSFQERIIKEVM